MHPLDTFNQDNYLGLWYEQARGPFFYKSHCCTASYARNEDQSIQVRNYCTDSGETVSAKGTQQDKASTLTVDFDIPLKFLAPFAKGNYWVLETKTENGKYTAALVGEPCRFIFWVLTRDEHPDKSVVQDMINRAEKTHGFNVKNVQMRDATCPPYTPPTNNT